jgi:hypothetical protein
MYLIPREEEQEDQEQEGVENWEVTA